MGLSSRAAQFVSDLTTNLLNPISGPHPSNPPPEHHHGMRSPEKRDVEDSKIQDGPDTSSFSAFLVSLLTSSDSGSHLAEGLNTSQPDVGGFPSGSRIKENGRKNGLLTNGWQSFGKAFHKENCGQSSESVVDCNMINDPKIAECELVPLKAPNEMPTQLDFPDISEPSVLLSDGMRAGLYLSLPVMAKGRKWVLLYSTQKNGISLSTLYRRSMLCPGYSLLVVGDTEGAVFGGLVEAPLQPTNKRKYQGTNSSFVFTNQSIQSSHPIIYRSTGANHYYTLCSTDFMAMGGGGHFALYLDGDLLSGTSSASATFGNSCLAHSKDFEVKEVELWGFVYASKYNEMITLCKTERPGICRW